ncbi:MAG: hypothetical protein OFPII_30760 [Osedax symbiont Rs1]|nr:MAG: hypothetical protein OFPII_30760 [Osedax symbiont Rs1]
MGSLESAIAVHERNNKKMHVMYFIVSFECKVSQQSLEHVGGTLQKRRQLV